MSRAPCRAPLYSCFSRQAWSIFGLSLFLSCAAQATFYWEINDANGLASGPDAGGVQFAEIPPHNPAFYRARLP